MYIGDSGSLSFLQNVRRIVSLAMGECEFTTDPNRHSILETVPHIRMPQSTDQLSLIYSEVKKLAQQFLLATAGIMDIYSPEMLFSRLESWVNNDSRDLNPNSCIFYLVIAIGAQVSHSDHNQEQAELYFSRGRQQAFYTFTDAPSLMTVQTYSLIAVYMLGASRRNAAFMNFGIATRATFALGMHLHSTHSLYDEKESLERQTTWRSVRMIDAFFSASLGRPPATSDLAVPSEGEPPVQNDDTSDLSRKVLALAAIYDRIVIEVYMKRAISVRLANSISEQLRAWTQNLPPSLDLSNFSDYDEEKLSGLIAATHVVSAYHWAIILLTRPFLTSQILQDMARKTQSRISNASTTSTTTTDASTDDAAAIKTFADACVSSSLRSLEIISALLPYTTFLPTRLPFLINAVCNIALVLGAAVFADQDKNFPLQEELAKTLRILRRFAPHDPQARRYENIIEFLVKAVETYIGGRERLLGERRVREVSLLFGTVGQPRFDGGEQQQQQQQQSVAAGAGAGVGAMTSQDNEALVSNSAPALPLGFGAESFENDGIVGLGAGFGAFVPGVDGASDGGMFPDPMLPPSSIFGEGPVNFPDDAYLFMEQEPSIFSFWPG